MNPIRPGSVLSALEWLKLIDCCLHQLINASAISWREQINFHCDI
jgi:hypothetical protein